MADSLFKSAPIEIPNKSGFDMSHENFFTAMCGTLTPCMVDYLLPNDTVSLGFSAQIQLPPMATDFYGEVVGKYELFFVPFRVLYGGWKNSIAPFAQGSAVGSDGSTTNYYGSLLPYIHFDSQMESYVSAGSLSDYLGLKCPDITDSSGAFNFNIFPFLAYHKIYDDWYRDSRITLPCFVPNAVDGSSQLSSLPFCSYDVALQVGATDTLFNGHCLCDLWQRNWPKDYFTNATAQPEAGDPASLSFKVDGSDGSFTIAGLRAANSLQMFMERNNMAGNRYQDRIRAHYGVYPSDAVTDKALYLGSGVVNVYTKSIYQQNLDNSTEVSIPVGGSSSGNPFSSVGTKYGSSQGVGSSSLCKKFTATEHGILMCIFSLVPRRYYSSGVRRQLMSYDISDVPYPTLAGVGDQEIYQGELTFRNVYARNTFGYSQRFSEYKFMNNEVHGLLRDGESLSSFCLQSNYQDQTRVFLTTDFIQIPTSYLDQVSAVNGDVSKYGCWNDTYFSYKKVSTLPAYSIPTLENMKHSHVENIPLGGTRL